MKYYIYARKSTDDEDRQILSIEAQLVELRAFATRENLTVVKEYVEAKTAKKPGRPLFNDLLLQIERGRADGILAWHPDRLARNSVDGGKIIYLVDQGIIKDLRFPTYRFDDNAQGKFMLSIAFGQSKYYIDALSENIRRGIRLKLSKGIWPQWAPLSYLNDRGTRAIIKDEGKAPFIEGNLEAQKEFLRKIGSNFILKERRLVFSSDSPYRGYLFGTPYPNWRRGWDLNPRTLSSHTLSRRAR
jgi:site-specific DNA recombinase